MSIKRQVLRNLFLRDTFVLWGKEWTVLEKISEGRLRDDGREIIGGIVIRSLDNKEKIHVLMSMEVEVDEEENTRRKRKEVQNKSYSELSGLESKYNPYIYKGLYISLVLLVSLTLGLMVFLSFVGH